MLQYYRFERKRVEISLKAHFQFTNHDLIYCKPWKVTKIKIREEIALDIV